MDCCYKKENDGSRYFPMAEENTADYNCDSNCVYSKDSEPESRYCFKKSGNIPSTCLHEKSKIHKDFNFYCQHFCIKGPIKTQFIREEGNETVVQDNHYYGDTGIISKRIMNTFLIDYIRDVFFTAIFYLPIHLSLFAKVSFITI